MPPRKAPDRRQNRATQDTGTVVHLRPDTAAIPPVPNLPDQRLLACTKRQWELFWASELRRLVLEPDMPALENLFRLYDQRERMTRIFTKKPFVTGSTGQVVAHPSAKVIASLDERIAKLEPRFGITPKGRLELGIKLGEAARSLDALNADFDQDGDGEEAPAQHEDPRRQAIDTTAR